MAQSLCNINSTIPFHSSSKSKLIGDHHRGFPEIRRPSSRCVNVVRAMAADRRENLDHLQKPGIKRREAAPAAAPLGLWDRFPTARTVQQMMETMDRMMEQPVVSTNNWPSPSPALSGDGGAYARGRTPWAIKEGEAEYKLRFDVPGMTKEDVKVWVEEKMLVIKAEKVLKNKTSQENGVVEDEGDWPAKSFGRYSWRIALPDNVEFEKIKAEAKDGVLYVTIPKPCSTTKVFDVNVE